MWPFSRGLKEEGDGALGLSWVSLEADKTTYPSGSYTLVKWPKASGIPEIVVCRILMFTRVCATIYLASTGSGFYSAISNIAVSYS